MKLGSVMLTVASLTISAGAMAAGAPVRHVDAAARIAPSDGGAAIELANAYWREHRTVEAFAAYRRALVLDNVMLETRLGTPIWSHEVARRVLAREQTLAAR